MSKLAHILLVEDNRMDVELTLYLPINKEPK
jgi:hypothetical protein